MPNGRTASQNELMDRIAELGPAFAERAAGFDNAARFPTENYDDLRDAGLLKLCIPVAAGGAGALRIGALGARPPMDRTSE